jgi:hypothetical protein
MAEITDRLPETAPASGLNVETPPLADGTSYRPLSLLALAGFGLSVLTVLLICLGGWMAVGSRHPIFFVVIVLLTPFVAAIGCFMLGMSKPLKIVKIAAFALAGVLAVLGLGGLLAYSSNDPWLLKEWVVVLPVVCMLVLWIARSRIARSEDTLSGLALCNWGFGLVGVFGLLYLAYYGATVLAVCKQSEAFTDDWLSSLQKGDLETAFALTLPPDQRPQDDESRRLRIETLLNQPGPQSPGLFSEFASRTFVRTLNGTSDTAKLQRLGMVDWTYDKGEFLVRYSYRLILQLSTVELEVAAQSRTDALQGRQWYIEIRATGWSLAVPPALSDLGQTVMRQGGPSRQFVDEWLVKWYHDDDDAYLLTLPAAQRDAVKRQRLALGPALGGTALFAEPGRQGYYDGGLIEADAKRFFPILPENRKYVPAALKKAFRPGGDKPAKSELTQAIAIPLFQSVGDATRLVYEMHFVLDDEKKKDQLSVDAQIILECDAAALAANKPQWQVKKIDLIRARSTNVVQAEAGMGGTTRRIAPKPPPLP